MKPLFDSTAGEEKIGFTLDAATKNGRGVSRGPARAPPGKEVEKKEVKEKKKGGLKLSSANKTLALNHDLR